MATQVELERIAGAVAKLRPEWSARAVRTYLEAKHADRAYADLAVALVVVACDPTSQTPARLDTHGPWWLATRVNVGQTTPDVGPGRGIPACTRPGHEHEAAHACRCCRAEAIAVDDEPEPVVIS